MKRGIYLVTNRRSEREAANLIYSLRGAGCQLPIALIPFDDRVPTHSRLLAETTQMDIASFPQEIRDIFAQIHELWPDSNGGLFRRMAAWYGPFDEFIYSDNDIVALGDWTPYFDHLDGYDLVHADKEYTTGGIFAYRQPATVVENFGPIAIDSLFTTGHFAARKNPDMTRIFSATLDWLRANPHVAFRVDGSFIHLATLIGKFRIKNMCQPPEDWPSPWAGDYRNALEVVQTAQRGKPLLQIHYSGGYPDGYEARDEFSFSDCTDVVRLRRLLWAAVRHWSGAHFLKRVWSRLKYLLKNKS